MSSDCDKGVTSMKMIVVFQLAIYVIFLLVTGSAGAEEKIFTKEYSYQASELDSKITCRTNALTQVKRLLLEELGTYLESYASVKNFELTKDKIEVLTSGTVKTEVMDEKWDGKSYWIKARLTADPAEVLKSIELSRKNINSTKGNSLTSGKEYRISFYAANIQPEPYGTDDSNPAPDTYILVKDAAGKTLFNTGDVYVKQKNFGTLLANRNNYNPNFRGVGFNHLFADDCIVMNLMDWDGCEGLLCNRNSDDDVIGSEYKICTGDKIGKRWIKAAGWEMEIEIFPVD